MGIGGSEADPRALHKDITKVNLKPANRGTSHSQPLSPDGMRGERREHIETEEEPVSEPLARKIPPKAHPVVDSAKPKATSCGSMDDNRYAGGSSHRKVGTHHSRLRKEPKPLNDQQKDGRVLWE